MKLDAHERVESLRDSCHFPWHTGAFDEDLNESVLGPEGFRRRWIPPAVQTFQDDARSSPITEPGCIHDGHLPGIRRSRHWLLGTAEEVSSSHQGGDQLRKSAYVN